MVHKSLFIFLIPVFILSELNVIAQTEIMKTSLEKMAIEKKYGILYCQVDSVALTSMTQSFIGLIDININSNRPDTLYKKAELKTPGGQKALMEICQQLVKRGVDYRKDENVKKALLCYRLPLYVTCSTGELDGANIISGNLWQLREQLKHTTTSKENTELLSIITKDATNILKENQVNWTNQSTPGKKLSKEFFNVYRRLNNLSGNSKEGSRIVVQKVNENKIDDYSIYLNGILEQLCETGIGDFTISNVDDPTGRDHDLNFNQLWKQYLEYRPYMINDLKTYSISLSNAFKQFGILRLDVLKAGGSFGNKLSYMVSDNYMQYLGRDLSFIHFKRGDYNFALEDAENVKSRSLADWIARSHPNKRMKSVITPAVQNANKVVTELQPATLNEMVQASRKENTYLLNFLNTMDGYFAWFIQPDGTYFYYEINLDKLDSLCRDLFQMLPYQQAQSALVPSLKMDVRGTVTRGITKKVNSDNKVVLKELYALLFPDTIGAILGSQNSKKMAIMADGVLNYIPFQCLEQKNGKYLLETVEITYWPSITAWLVLKDAENVFDLLTTQSEKDKILILGNPRFKGEYSTTINGVTTMADLSPLPGTAVEVEAIGKILNSEPLQQDKVNSVLLEEKRKLKILHLATHGFSNTSDGMQSFIAFSDGMVNAENMYENAGFLKCKLTVLSACQTGVGTMNNDSPIGLANSFLIAGANNVVSTLWSIDDDASAELMIAFYTFLKEGKSISESLRLAQLQLRKIEKWSSPFFWAAFKLMGTGTSPFK
jgi:CHAT domain-containing protein